jgi:membrane protease YdiL (CAAX protease family)
MSVALVVSSGLTALVLSNRLTTLLPEIGQVGVRIALLVVFYLFELLGLVWLAHRRELTFAQAYRLKPEPAGTATRAGTSSPETKTYPAWTTALLTVGLLIALRAVGIAYNAVTSGLGWPAPSSESMTALFGNSLYGLAGALVSVVLLAPVIEELVFRVIMQETFAKKVAPLLAIVLQALIFSVYHLSLWAALPNLLLALATGWLAARSRSIWPALILHISYNAVVVAAAFYLALT